MKEIDKMIFKNYRKAIRNLLIYFESLSIENKLKLIIIVLKSNMIKLKIDKEKLIELLKDYLCIFDKNYKKNTLITLEYNMDIFILAKVMEMNETERNMIVYEMLAEIYRKIIQYK